MGREWAKGEVNDGELDGGGETRKRERKENQSIYIEHKYQILHILFSI